MNEIMNLSGTRHPQTIFFIVQIYLDILFGYVCTKQHLHLQYTTLGNAISKEKDEIDEQI